MCLFWTFKLSRPGFNTGKICAKAKMSFLFRICLVSKQREKNCSGTFSFMNIPFTKKHSFDLMLDRSCCSVISSAFICSSFVYLFFIHVNVEKPNVMASVLYLLLLHIGYQYFDDSNPSSRCVSYPDVSCDLSCVLGVASARVHAHTQYHRVHYISIQVFPQAE